MSISAPKPPIRVGMISLGCAKNLVDAEIMLGSLLKDGVEITNDAAQADCVIVNTCSFIDSAQEESVDTILESVQVREAQNRGQGLVVSGCLSQRFRDQLPSLFPEVDAFMGIDQVAQVGTIVREAIARRDERIRNPKPDIRRRKSKVAAKLAELDRRPVADDHESRNSLRGTDKFGKTRTVLSLKPSAPILDVTPRPVYIPDYVTPRLRLTPRHFAYLKIAEGCNHPCSFCIIPRMRGSHRSRTQSDIVAEAKRLIADGVREINLISQDSTYYGLDLRPVPQRCVRCCAS
jgi:ribosomal protein S12 methylthiotransferase